MNDDYSAETLNKLLEAAKERPLTDAEQTMLETLLARQDGKRMAVDRHLRENYQSTGSGRTFTASQLRSVSAEIKQKQNVHKRQSQQSMVIRRVAYAAVAFACLMLIITFWPLLNPPAIEPAAVADRTTRLSNTPTATSAPTMTPTLEPTQTPAPTPTFTPTPTVEPTQEAAADTTTTPLLDDQARANAALQNAVRDEDPLAVADALAAGADINVAGTAYYLTPIVGTIRRGDLETFTLLLEAGADITIEDGEQNSLLHIAIEAGAVEILEALLEAEVIDIEHRRALWQFTSLHVAALEGNLEMVNLLIAAGADINALTEVKDSVFNVAVYGGSLDIVTRLFDLGADPNVVNVYQENALDIVRYRDFQNDAIEAFLLSIMDNPDDN